MELRSWASQGFHQEPYQVVSEHGDLREHHSIRTDDVKRPSAISNHSDPELEGPCLHHWVNLELPAPISSATSTKQMSSTGNPATSRSEILGFSFEDRWPDDQHKIIAEQILADQRRCAMEMFHLPSLKPWSSPCPPTAPQPQPPILPRTLFPISSFMSEPMSSAPPLVTSRAEMDPYLHTWKNLESPAVSTPPLPSRSMQLPTLLPILSLWQSPGVASPSPSWMQFQVQALQLEVQQQAHNREKRLEEMRKPSLLRQRPCLSSLMPLQPVPLQPLCLPPSSSCLPWLLMPPFPISPPLHTRTPASPSSILAAPSSMPLPPPSSMLISLPPFLSSTQVSPTPAQMLESPSILSLQLSPGVVACLTDRLGSKVFLDSIMSTSRLQTRARTDTSDSRARGLYTRNLASHSAHHCIAHDPITTEENQLSVIDFSLMDEIVLKDVNCCSKLNAEYIIDGFDYLNFNLTSLRLPDLYISTINCCISKVNIWKDIQINMVTSTTLTESKSRCNYMEIVSPVMWYPTIPPEPPPLVFYSKWLLVLKSNVRSKLYFAVQSRLHRH